MPFYFVAAERIRRLERGTLSRRPDAELPFIDTNVRAGSALLLDTCVYIDRMQDRVPESVQKLIDVRIVHHSAVAVQELMHTVGVLEAVMDLGQVLCRVSDVRPVGGWNRQDLPSCLF